jgi:hypothetical protein
MQPADCQKCSAQEQRNRQCDSKEHPGGWRTKGRTDAMIDDHDPG